MCTGLAVLLGCPGPARRPGGTPPRPVRLVLTPCGWQDYAYWLTADRATLKRINRLTDDVLRDPFEGIGKAEPLRPALTGARARRISEEHRLVYLVDGDDIVILQARYHYT